MTRPLRYKQQTRKIIIYLWPKRTRKKVVWYDRRIPSTHIKLNATFVPPICEVTVLSRVRPKNILNSTGFFPMYLLSWAFSVISRLEVCNALPFAILPSLRNPHNYHSFFSLIFCRLCKFIIIFIILCLPILLFPFLSPLPSFFFFPTSRPFLLLFLLFLG